MRHIIYILLLWSSIATATEITVGAIRWDAWTGGHVTDAVERTLGPEKYHFRLPWFAKILDKNKVHIDGSPQSVMDQEIKFASNAGLDYWAFLLYPKSNPMSTAFKNYLKSPERNKINFSIILQRFNTSGKKWKKKSHRIIKLLLRPEYQTVLDGRPLVYIFTKHFSEKKISALRKFAKKAGVNPYFVYMGWEPVSDYKRVAGKGIDAVSSYAKGCKKPKFSTLVKNVEKDWKRAAKKNIPYIPLVTTGWDKRPRQENHVPWEKNAKYLQQKIFPATGTPEEISSELTDALTFVKAHPQTCIASTIIIYAWNEYDEGGWISPTWQKNGKLDTSRLDAIEKVLLP